MRPACGLFPPSSFHKALFALTMRPNFCYSLLTANDSCPRPLLSTSLLSLHVNRLLSNPSFVISHPLLTICHMYLAICHHFSFAIGYAFFVMLHGQGLVLTSLSVSKRLFTTKAPQATRHALRTNRPPSITHLGTRKYPTQPSPLEGFQMLVS